MVLMGVDRADGDRPFRTVDLDIDIGAEAVDYKCV